MFCFFEVAINRILASFGRVAILGNCLNDLREHLEKLILVLDVVFQVVQQSIVHAIKCEFELGLQYLAVQFISL